MGFLGRGQPAPPHQMGVCGSAVSSSGAEPRPPKGFLVFCAVRLPFPASQYELHTVCMARFSEGVYIMNIPPQKYLVCQIPCIRPASDACGSRQLSFLRYLDQVNYSLTSRN